MKVCAIYAIFCTKNFKPYVGSTCALSGRIQGHKSELTHRKHHSSKFQNSFNKYGVHSFCVVVLESCEKDELLIREQFWIDKLDSYKNGLNGSWKAERPMCIPKTKEQLRVQGESMSRWASGSDGARFFSTLAINNGNRTRGVPRDDSVKKKMSDAAVIRYKDPFQRMMASVIGQQNIRNGSSKKASATKKRNFINNHFPCLGYDRFQRLFKKLIDQGFSTTELSMRFAICSGTIKRWVSNKKGVARENKPKQNKKKEKPNPIYIVDCICKECLEPFKASGKKRFSRVFCCKECRVLNLRRGRRQRTLSGEFAPEKACKRPGCGNKFRSNRKDFCCDKCKRDYFNGLRYQKKTSAPLGAEDEQQHKRTQH
jgi:group I intron endonuclease